MLVDIMYTRVLEFLGRNGHFKCAGITVTATPTYVCLMPITSKKAQGRAFIDVPMEDVDSLIAALQKAKSER
jgi:hypothetical protein